MSVSMCVNYMDCLGTDMKRRVIVKQIFMMRAERVTFMADR